MDYIYEELLRQQKALRQLLVGQGETTGEEAPGEETKKQEQAWTDQEAAASPVSSQQAAGAGAGLIERALEAAMENAGSHDLAQRQRDLNQVWKPLLQEEQPVREQSGTPAAEELLWEGDVPVLYQGSWDRASRRADVRAVSRMVQQDARRYDGGFTLY